MRGQRSEVRGGLGHCAPQWGGVGSDGALDPPLSEPGGLGEVWTDTTRVYILIANKSQFFGVLL